MQDPHAPHDAFVERLEEKIGREVRRRNALAESRRWLPQWQIKTVAGIAALILVSMAIGGAVVNAAYQAQNNEQRDALTASYERRSALAKQRVLLAQQEMQTAEQRAAIGLLSQEAIFEGRAKLVEAQSAVRIIELQLLEIQATTREPLNVASAPLASGRDFVTERWKIEMSVPVAALESEQMHLRTAAQKVALGVADPADVDVSRARVLEIQAGIEAFQRKLDIRQRFLKGDYDAALADLRVLEVDAEQRRKALLPKIDVAQKSVVRLDERVRTGTASALERGEAQLRLLQLQTDLTELDVQLAVVRKQIDQRKIK